MLLLPFAECHDPWFPYSSNLPHTPCICPAWNGARTSPFQGKSIERRPPRFLISFFPREDNCTMTWRCLVMHHCPRSICLLQVHHLTLNICSRKLLFSRSEALSREHLLILNSSPITFLQQHQNRCLTFNSSSECNWLSSDSTEMLCVKLDNTFNASIKHCWFFFFFSQPKQSKTQRS